MPQDELVTALEAFDDTKDDKTADQDAFAAHQEQLPKVPVAGQQQKAELSQEAKRADSEARKAKTHALAKAAAQERLNAEMAKTKRAKAALKVRKDAAAKARSDRKDAKTAILQLQWVQPAGAASNPPVASSMPAKRPRGRPRKDASEPPVSSADRNRPGRTKKDLAAAPLKRSRGGGPKAGSKSNKRSRLASSSKNVQLRVAAYQMAERHGDQTDEDALAAVKEAAEAAARRGAELLLFPELSLTGYSVGAKLIRSRAQSRDGPLMQAVAGIAEKIGIALAVG